MRGVEVQHIFCRRFTNFSNHRKDTVVRKLLPWARQKQQPGFCCFLKDGCTNHCWTTTERNTVGRQATSVVLVSPNSLEHNSSSFKVDLHASCKTVLESFEESLLQQRSSGIPYLAHRSNCLNKAGSTLPTLHCLARRFTCLGSRRCFGTLLMAKCFASVETTQLFNQVGGHC